ncbi:zinc-dependent metalloprotease [Hymenobacter weizhouensis]|uniref:zinc-dependent metalloprotease n=1 Tax=Hymenobacter sp. YIM 151500-1 TaxID=2987689 RepID=UPI0022267975|nr:zinc-dependent metalloprotease [Hymenobacter sp. YIM 151500-1]UYZ63229.1 zinc-dependent metalloprotease [Hymenobacter sp. YIM 151500-1]
MKRMLPVWAAGLALTLTVAGCTEKENVPAAAGQEISAATLSQIRQLGFSTQNVRRDEDGNYLVEGDILLTAQNLQQRPTVQLLRVGQDEQYRTTNLVTGLPRTITVSISNQFPASFTTALDVALDRYNAENLQLRFARVSSGADIRILRGAGDYLASAGFPSGGEPFNLIRVNSRAFGPDISTGTIASVLAHEIGHCIGFRHTDYMDRSYSCGGQAVNEGASTVGAIYIPGTAVGPDPDSWMLSCIGADDDRPFNANDKTALDYLY